MGYGRVQSHCHTEGATSPAIRPSSAGLNVPTTLYNIRLMPYGILLNCRSTKLSLRFRPISFILIKFNICLLNKIVRV